jgi:hypothetical protein
VGKGVAARRQVRDRFSLALIDALRRAHPEVFAGKVVP